VYIREILEMALYTIDHNVLLFKMNRIGVRGIVYEWFKDYLTNRRQYVTANGLNSDINSVKCGVPHGLRFVVKGDIL